MKDKRLAFNTIIVVAAFAFDKLLALLRDWVIGRRFGVGYEYDAFTAAIQAPELLFTLIAGGALVAAFIPVLSESLTSSRPEEGWRLASAVLNIVLLVLLAFGLVVGLSAETVCTRWLVPNFTPDKQALTARLLRIVLLQTFLFGAGGVVVGILHAHQHFFLPAIAPIFYNLGQIFGALFLAPRMGISGLTWGMAIGAGAYLLIQVPALARFRARYFVTLGLRLAGVQKIARLMLPRLVALGMVEMADVIYVRLGSRLPDGHLSAYFWGWRLMQLPETLFGTAIAQVFFPTLSELASMGDQDGFIQKANGALRVVLTLTIPSAAGLILLGRPALLLVGGAFDKSSVALIHAALVIFCLRLLAEAMLEIGARLFYARQDTFTPMVVAVLGQGVSIGLGYGLINNLGYRGLAWATTIGFWVESILLLAIIQRRLGGILNRDLLLSAGRALVGTLALSAAIILTGVLLPVSGGRLQIGLSTAAAATAGVLTYISVLIGLKSPELKAVPTLLRKRSSGE